MALAWILVLVTLLAGPKAGSKLKRAKSKRNKLGFSEQDYELPESEVSSIDWDALGSDDDDEVEATTVTPRGRNCDPGSPTDPPPMPNTA